MALPRSAASEQCSAASTRRLARSVVERTGRTGKHYIARNAAQWRVMGLGAVLAGVITSFTALFKYSLSAVIHAPILLAFAHSMNYVVSFLLMQAGGFLLASKMPAATAATLVDAMEDPEKDHMASLQAISKTQFIVTISNLVGAVPVSILIDRIIHGRNRTPVSHRRARRTRCAHALSAHLEDDFFRHRDWRFSVALFARHRMDRELSRPPQDGNGDFKQSSHSRPAWTKAGREARRLGGPPRRWISRIHRSGFFARRRAGYFRAIRNSS